MYAAKQTIIYLLIGYLVIGGGFYALSVFSYTTMWVPLLFQDCGIMASSFAMVIGGVFGTITSLVKIVLWPYGLWSLFTTDLQLLPWLFPGWYAHCG